MNDEYYVIRLEFKGIPKFEYLKTIYPSSHADWLYITSYPDILKAKKYKNFENARKTFNRLVEYYQRKGYETIPKLLKVELEIKITEA